MNDERWVRNLAEAARGFNEPPETPRERLWEGIDRARAEARLATVARRAEPWWSRRRALWPAAVIAALAVGLTVGRVTGPAREAATPTAQEPVVSQETMVTAESSIARNPASRGDGAPEEAYRLAALPVLQRSESLLLQVRTGFEPAHADEAFTDRAVTLLGQTRLLLDSPAARDPNLASLLQDLELALARIVRLAADPRPSTEIGPERKTLDDGLERTAILPRIRDELAAGPVVVGS